MNDLDFASTVARLNALRQQSRVWHATAKALRAILAGLVIMALWSVARPGDNALMIAFGALASLMVYALGEAFGGVPVTAEALAVDLTLRHPDLPVSRLKQAPADTPEQAAAWQACLAAAVADMEAFVKRRFLADAGTLVVPLLMLAALLQVNPDAIAKALAQVQHAVATLSQGATLRVVDGAPREMKENPVSLSAGRTAKLELLSTNLVELAVDVAGGKNDQPRVELRKTTSDAATGQAREETFQSFLLSPAKDQSDGALVRFTQSFSLNEDVSLYVSTLSLRTPAAVIHVRQLPIPVVSLATVGTPAEPWPDDKALPLKIDVKAENPLAQVRLRIASGGKSQTELVSTVMAQDKKTLSTTYSLLLEPYLEEDMAEVEITAEALDRSHPTPLLGRSRPIVIKTASAYGRYRQTLATLREIKTRLDDDVQNHRVPVDAETLKASDEALRQADDSPFFDGLDRMSLAQLMNSLSELKDPSDLARKMELGEALNEFLFEHESLDDRERDRDFFVAARGLSRLIERADPKQPANVVAVSQRVKAFVAERHGRWDKRVARLGDEFRPPLWDRSVSHHPFESALADVGRLFQTGDKGAGTRSLAALSKTVAAYKEWIEELEAKEDAARQSQEKKRQEGLANAQNKLRELQRRQGVVSTILDKADQRPAESLSEQWPRARMEQNTNAEETSRFEGELRSLSPAAAARIKAAAEAMKGTLEKGGEKKFAEAETFSDAAGRLLRQAESAAQRSKSEQRRRGRRRQVTGDNYYGQQVTGGDVEIRREYQVSRRYREDVLDDVRGMQARGIEPEDEEVLDDYLRKVVR